VNDRAAYRRLVRDVVLVGAADVLKSLRILVVLPLLSKSLGIEAYGVWSQIKVSATFLGPLASLGMTSAVLRFLSGQDRMTSVREGFNSALWTAMCGSLVLAVLLLTSPTRVASLLFGEPDLSLFVVATGVYLILEVVDLLVMAYLRASRQMGFHVTTIAIELVGEAALVWILVSRRLDLAGVVFGIIGWKAAVVLSKLARTWYQIGIERPRASIVRQYLAFGIPLVLSGSTYLIVNYGDRYFVAFFMGIESLGLYAAAYAVGSLTIVLPTTIDYVMYPAVAAEWNAGRLADATRHVNLMLRWLAVLLVPILAGLAVTVGPIMAAIATEESAAAAPVAFVVALGFAIFCVGIVGERLLVLADRPRTVTATYAILAFVNIGLNMILIPRLGLMGAALATLVSFSLYSMITLTVARRHCQFHFPIAVLSRSLAAGIVGAAVAVPFAGNGVARIVVTIAAGGLAYGVTLLAIGGLGPNGLTPVRADAPAVAQRVE
jgi:O-antigen/teichoic acid export membrane protein